MSQKQQKQEKCYWANNAQPWEALQPTMLYASFLYLVFQSFNSI